MRKLFLLLADFAGCTSVFADEKTDVTQSYVSNSSFEADDISTLTAENNSNDGLRGYKVTAPTGWTVTN